MSQDRAVVLAREQVPVVRSASIALVAVQRAMEAAGVEAPAATQKVKVKKALKNLQKTRKSLSVFKISSRPKVT